MNSPIDLFATAPYQPGKMGKSTAFQSERVLVGLNAFEPGQEHASHAHAGADKVYVVLEGNGLFTLGDAEHRLRAGQCLAAPAGVPHGVRNDGGERLLVLAVIAPAPK
ncbi:MAG: cupin domain-containing protein [Planctomycetes bacterium]|nr:cupin domain-containing protein [Planctomycetota bacterium]